MKQILTALSIIALMLSLASCEKTCNCNCNCCNQGGSDQTIQRPGDNNQNDNDNEDGDLNSSPDGIDRSDYIVYNNTMTKGKAGYYGQYYQDQPSTTANWFIELAESNYDLDEYEGTGFNVSLEFFTPSSNTTSIAAGIYTIEAFEKSAFSVNSLLYGYYDEYEYEGETIEYPAGTWLFEGNEAVAGATAGQMIVSVSNNKYTINYGLHDDESKVTFIGTFTGNLTFYDGTEAYAALAQTKPTKAPKTSRLTKHFRVRR